MVFQNPLAAAILFIALLAEVNRAPFDLPEAEQELTAGYHSEYSGMKFALFYLAEYIGMITVSMVASAFYLGGYHFVFVDRLPLLGPLVYAAKVILLLMGMVWVRATLPRIRYDRLMHFGWKIMPPLAMAAVAWRRRGLPGGAVRRRAHGSLLNCGAGAVPGRRAGILPAPGAGDRRRLPGEHRRDGVAQPGMQRR